MTTVETHDLLLFSAFYMVLVSAIPVNSADMLSAS